MLKFKYLALLGLFLLLAACGRSPAPAAPATPSSQASEAVTPASAVTPVPSNPTEVAVDYCTSCHTDEQQLKNTVKPEEAANVGQGMGPEGGVVNTMQPWQKVLVDGVNFPSSIHGLNGCTSCHGGVQDPDKEKAHQGMVPNPSKDPYAVCGKCHPDVVASSGDNLHFNLKGFSTMLHARSVPGNDAVLQEAIDNNCSSCHTTCGDCHVSQPSNIGGGFVSGHVFNRKPSMTENCAVCHSTRAGNEYMGNNKGVPADVHYSQGGFECINCHTTAQVHGQQSDCSTCHPGPEKSQLPPPDHRYDGTQAPRCESCHPDASAGKDDILMHQMHGSKLSCQVCHSVTYTSCDGCHVGVDQKSNQPYYNLDKSYATFLIGRNPQQSYERPYDFVPVRHVPIAPDTFASYGDNLLPNFSKLETWKYATPHNIQRNTPQAASCNNCHGNPALFLTVDKVAPNELKANQDVIVNQLPPLITSAEQIPDKTP